MKIRQSLTRLTRTIFRKKAFLKIARVSVRVECCIQEAETF